MYIIGLTGNIAAGKSTVCRILRELGAHVIDADIVAHNVLRRGSPCWRALIDNFGYDVLHPDGTVDRRKLGALVFGDPAKLRILERITHPAVGTELALIVRDLAASPSSANQVVVIEAVKLYEAGLTEYLDALWVVTAPEQEQLRRMVTDRGMSEADARARLAAQPPLDDKLKRATVVIDNGGTLQETQVQVLRAFAAIDPKSGREIGPLLRHWLGLDKPPTPTTPTPATPTPAPAAPTEPPAPLEVRRAGPGDARLLADLLGRLSGKGAPLTRAEMLERQGKYGYWLARAGERPIALAGWRAENLAAVVQELWVDDAAAKEALPQLLKAIQAEADALTCEVVVLVLPKASERLGQIAILSAGYEPTAVTQLHKAWRGVVEPSLAGDELLYLKSLREIVTKPI